MKKMQGSPQPLGVTISGKKTNYAVAVPTGASCELVLFQPGEEMPFARFEMPEAESVGEVRFLALNYDKPWKYEYQYLIDGKAVPDPYARILYRKAEPKQIRCGYPAPYDWEGDKALQIPDYEVIAYSLHVRGFTMHPSSKVRKKGTFQGLAAKIPYLLELGINQIQCMPVYEF